MRTDTATGAGTAELEASVSLGPESQPRANPGEYPSARNNAVRRPRMRIVGPVLDASDPIALAEFYERLLGWTIVEQEGARPSYPAEDAWAKLRSPDGDMKIEIQWEEHYVRPTWPGAAGEQLMMLHLDIEVDDLEAGMRWAQDVGAVLADHQPQDDVRVMLDPEGHPFCLFPSS